MNSVKKIVVGLSLVNGLSFAAFSQDKPNVILILADDQGWGTTSVMMNKSVPASKSDFIKTPNLERLAAQSIIYSNGYAAHPNCSPTRASILTGKSPAQLHLTDIIERHSGNLYDGNKLIPPSHIDGLPTNEITIAEIIKSQRPEYATAHFGKWHLGSTGPEKHGFDKSDGKTGNREGSRNLPGNPKDVFGVTDRTIKWMDQQVDSKKPFFLQVSHYATHLAVETKPETVEKIKNRTPGKRHQNVRFAGMSQDLDDGIGLLLDEVKRLGIADNTYIIYLADNGSQPTKDLGNINGPLHGWKATIWEGGVRVPFFISGPGIKPNYSEAIVSSSDLFPTICEWLGINKMPSGVEGASLVNSLKNPQQVNAVKRKNDFLVFHFPHYQLEKGSQPATAIVKGNYKLMKFYEDNSFYLFNLKDDISETVNLAKTKPEIAKSLNKQLQAYLKEIGAGLPALNTKYDAANDPGKKFLSIKKDLLQKPYFILKE